MLLVALGAFVSCRERGPAVVAVVAPMPTPQFENALRARFEGDSGGRGSVRLLFENFTPQAGAELPVLQAEALISTPGLVGVAGHESSRASLQAAPAYEDRGVVQIVPTGTSNKLGKVSPWTFPLVASDSIQGELLAKYLMQRRFTRVAVFVQDDEYGRDVLAELRRVLLGSDVSIVDDITLVPNSDIPLLVQSALSQHPRVEAFVTIAQVNVATSIARISWAAHPKLTIIGSDAVTGSPELAALAPSREQLAIVTYWLPDTTDAVTREYVSMFTRIVGRAPHWADAATYDAIGLLATGARESGANPNLLREWIQSLGKSRPPYHGLLGLIDFNGRHRINPQLVSPTPDGWRLVP